MADYTSEHTGVEIDLAVENANLMLLTGSEDPATSTVGTLGQIYQNTTDGTLFRCTAIAGTDYTWTEWADYSLAEKAKVTGATAAALVLTGMTEAETYSALADTDTINTAFGKVKKFFTDIATTIRGTLLTGLSVETATDVEATDTLLVGVGKLQGQTNAIDTKIGTQTYTEDNYVTDGASVTENIDALDMAVKDNADLISTKRNSETVVYDQTFSEEWSTATLSADTGTSNITHIAHGFADGTIAEFEANDGVLPTGIIDTNVDMFGKFYRINKVDNDTYFISEIGTADKIALTSTGSGAWRARKLVEGFTITGLNHDLSFPHKFEIIGTAVRKAGGSLTYPFFRLNADSTKKYICANNALAGNQTFMGLWVPNVANYNKFRCGFTLQESETSTTITGACGGVGTTDKSAPTPITVVLNGEITSAIGSITGFSFGAVTSANMGFRSGLRIRIVKEA